MRENYYYLLLAITLIGCESAEDLVQDSKSKKNPTQTYIINGDIVYEAEITDGRKSTKPIFIYDLAKEPLKDDLSKKSTSKSVENSVKINFNYGIAGSTKSGCTVKRYNNGNSYYTDDGVYGANPAPQENGYLIRGYGVPHHNIYYNSLILMASNKGKKTYTRNGLRWHDNDPQGSAISIEYLFKAYVTYEISLTVVFYDNRYLVDKVYSSGYPTVYVQLNDDGIITLPNIRTQTQDPCATDGINSLGEYAFDYLNYTRTYTLENQAVIQRTLNFKFSPTNEKKALLISLHPSTSVTGFEAPIYTNNYTMAMPLINITEKPFDASLNIEVTPQTPGRR